MEIEVVKAEAAIDELESMVERVVSKRRIRIDAALIDSIGSKPAA